MYTIELKTEVQEGTISVVYILRGGCGGREAWRRRGGGGGGDGGHVYRLHSLS